MMIETKRSGLANWLAPAFLLGLVAVFLLAPFSLKNKLDGVCYGI